MPARTEPSPRPRPSRGSGALPHVTIEHVTPAVDDGRYAAKRILGDVCTVGADIFKDGHDLLRARVRFSGPQDSAPRYAPMLYDKDEDRWVGAIALDAIGPWTFTVEAWTDQFGSWRVKFEKKVAAEQEVGVELMEATAMVREAARKTRFGESRRKLEAYAKILADTSNGAAQVEAALAPELVGLMEAHHAPADLVTYDRELPLWVDRERAAFAAWYEFFPRSTGPDGEHGTFATAEEALPRIAALGFDVIYLPPIHPIGRTFRKGRNNTLIANPDDVGSPWAIGSDEGGHDAVNPSLGTVEDFERFVRRAAALGLEVALDYALQCSPDHPWVKSHPDWFHIRPDGTIAYAENPPKKYQDIYPINFWCDDRESLWNACRDVLLLWVERGVTTFRVDNPHTKPFAFWQWVIREVQAKYPEVVFLSEAFTRPKKLLSLAKLGFTQSYGYFTWKTEAWQIEQWLEEFLAPDVVEYHRGNFFTNTPDILHEYLVTGGPNAFRIRLLLAATLSPLYGIYSGFEHFENVPVREGSEEYVDSEKYQLRHRKYHEIAHSLDADITQLNAIRRDERALQRQDNVTFLKSQDEAILCYRRAAVGDSADLIVTVLLDPHQAHYTFVDVPIADMGIEEDEPYVVEDLLTGARYTWRGTRNYVRLDPATQPAHLLRVIPPTRPAETMVEAFV